MRRRAFSSLERRPWARAVLVAALLVPAATATHGQARTGSLSIGAVRELVVALVVPAGVAAAVAVAAALFVMPFPVHGQQRRRVVARRRGAGALAIGLAIVACVLLTTVALVGGGPRGRLHVAGSTSPVAQPRDSPARASSRPQPGWPVVTGVAAATLVAIAGAGVALRRRSGARDSRPFRHAANTRAGPVKAGPPGPLPDHPRAAVLAAYARMEARLAADGYIRQRSEAPWAYWRRVAGRLGRRRREMALLTALYERAAYSPHRIEVTDRTTALRILAVLELDAEDR